MSKSAMKLHYIVIAACFSAITCFDLSHQHNLGRRMLQMINSQCGTTTCWDVGGYVMLRVWGLDVDQKMTIYRPDNQLSPEMERDKSLPPLAGRSKISMHQSLLEQFDKCKLCIGKSNLVLAYTRIFTYLTHLN
jgi:hypothetical protein